jgi:hypothetical protein
MARWVKCSDNIGQVLWVNLDNVTMMTWRDTPKPGNEITFIGGGQVFARERPEDLTKA